MTMSYIPDFRTHNNFERLGEDTQEYLTGYHQAITDLMGYLTGNVDCFEDFDELDAELLDRLEGRFSEDEQRDIIRAILLEVGGIANINEKEAWCGLLESDPEFPDDFEAEDLDGGPYIREENKRKKGEPLYLPEDYGFEADDSDKEEE